MGIIEHLLQKNELEQSKQMNTTSKCHKCKNKRHTARSVLQNLGELQQKHEQIQAKLIQKIMSAKMQLQLIQTLVNEKQNKLTRESSLKNDEAQDYIKQQWGQSEDNIQQETTAGNEDGELAIVYQEQSSEQATVKEQSPKLTSTMGSESQAFTLFISSVPKVTKNHSEQFEMFVAQLQQMHRLRSLELISEQMRLQQQRQLELTISEYETKMQSMKYVLLNKQSDVVADHVFKHVEELPKSAGLKAFTKQSVQINNIHILCNKIQQLNKQVCTLQTKCTKDAQECKNENHDAKDKQNICHIQNIIQNRPYALKQTTKNGQQQCQQHLNFKLLNDPFFIKILKIITKQRKKANALTDQYKEIYNSYKQKCEENKKLSNQYLLQNQLKLRS